MQYLDNGLEVELYQKKCDEFFSFNNQFQLLKILINFNKTEKLFIETLGTANQLLQ